jgi:hypothetical protein
MSHSLACFCVTAQMRLVINASSEQQESREGWCVQKNARLN